MSVSPCPFGRGWPTSKAAKDSRRGQREGATVFPCPRNCARPFHVRAAPSSLTSPVRPGRRRDTGFPRQVKLAIRTRAGDGDPCQARCEHCGAHLGISGGEFQHVVARHMGGTRDPLLSTAANGTLLCPPSHRLAESRSEEMFALGFWARQGTDPRTVPMMLWSPGGRVRVWRGMNGGYLTEAPKELAA